MGDDGFERFDRDAAVRRHQREAARRAAEASRQEPVMQAQERSRQRTSRRGAPQARLERHDVDGEPRWTLHGEPVEDGSVLEVYTNRANGWLKGQIVGAAYGRPRLLLTLWDPWGPRDADGLPPRVGKAEIPIPEGAMCRWSAAMPTEVD